MQVKKNINIYFLESEVKEALLDYMVKNGMNDVAAHAFENYSMLDYTPGSNEEDEDGNVVEDVYVLCVDGEMDDESSPGKEKN
jgi:hypothetical protein